MEEGKGPHVPSMRFCIHFCAVIRAAWVATSVSATADAGAGCAAWHTEETSHMYDPAGMSEIMIYVHWWK